jgi:hypothetical protein
LSAFPLRNKAQYLFLEIIGLDIAIEWNTIETAAVLLLACTCRSPDAV